MSKQYKEEWARKQDKSQEEMEAGDFEKARKLSGKSRRLWIETLAKGAGGTVTGKEEGRK